MITIIILIVITLITMKIVVMLRKRQRGKLEVWKYEYSDMYSLWYD